MPVMYQSTVWRYLFLWTTQDSSSWLFYTKSSWSPSSTGISNPKLTRNARQLKGSYADHLLRPVHRWKRNRVSLLPRISNRSFFFSRYPFQRGEHSFLPAAVARFSHPLLEASSITCRLSISSDMNYWFTYLPPMCQPSNNPRDGKQNREKVEGKPCIVTSPSGWSLV